MTLRDKKAKRRQEVKRNDLTWVLYQLFCSATGSVRCVVTSFCGVLLYSGVQLFHRLLILMKISKSISIQEKHAHLSIMRLFRSSLENFLLTEKWRGGRGKTVGCTKLCLWWALSDIRDTRRSRSSITMLFSSSESKDLLFLPFQELGALRNEQNEELQASLLAVRTKNRDDRGKWVHWADKPA